MLKKMVFYKDLPKEILCKLDISITKRAVHLDSLFAKAALKGGYDPDKVSHDTLVKKRFVERFKKFKIMIHTIKVKGCFDCPFRDSRDECEILNPFVEHDPWHNVGLLEVKFGEFHEKCPLNYSKIEIVKYNE